MKDELDYNMQEEIRYLLDADYKKDIVTFEKAKQHILDLLGTSLDDTSEYTTEKQKLITEFFKSLRTYIDAPQTEQAVQSISQELYLFTEAYNAITERYMKDVIHEILKYANGTKHQ